MTDKQIIIDGIDVSKWNYFNNTDKSYCEECCSEFGCAICNDRPNCYYKQLKAKEQECEELKETLAEIKKIAEKAAKCLYATESDDYTDGYRWLGSIILQKIRKYEVENDD